MYIIFNKLCQQRVKYDVHTMSKIKHTRHFLITYYFSLGIRKEMSTLSSANFTDGNILLTEHNHIMKITYSRSARA